MNLLYFGCLVAVNVLWLFLRVSWIGLKFLIVVFPDYTHLLFVRKWAFTSNNIVIIKVHASVVLLFLSNE